MAECRIKVLKRLVVTDIAKEYIDSYVGPCPLLNEGQEFRVPVTLEKPSGFCDWAWTDLHPYVVALSRGGNFSQDIFAGWMKDDNTMIACCTDGVRPVIFEIKRLPE